MKKCEPLSADSLSLLSAESIRPLKQVIIVLMGLSMIFFILSVPLLRKELFHDLRVNWFRCGFAGAGGTSVLCCRNAVIVLALKPQSHQPFAHGGAPGGHLLHVVEDHGQADSTDCDRDVRGGDE